MIQRGKEEKKDLVCLKRSILLAITRNNRSQQPQEKTVASVEINICASSTKNLKVQSVRVCFVNKPTGSYDSWLIFKECLILKKKKNFIQFVENIATN